MKTIQLSALLLALFLTRLAAPAEEGEAKHWYRLFLHQEDEKKSIIVSSTAPPAEVAAAFSGTAFVAFGDLRVPGSMTETSVLSWLAPQGTAKGALVFVNPRHVVYFVEWAGEPKMATNAPPAGKP